MCLLFILGHELLLLPPACSSLLCHLHGLCSDLNLCLHWGSPEKPQQMHPNIHPCVVIQAGICLRMDVDTVYVTPAGDPGKLVEGVAGVNSV